MYTDEHEKHIAVRGLAVGDVLECRSILTVTTPFAPGQFWFSHNFLKSSITLHERLEISVPKDRTVKIHSPGVKPEISDDADRRTYAFQSANVTKHPDPDKKGCPLPDRDNDTVPDAQPPLQQREPATHVLQRAPSAA